MLALDAAMLLAVVECGCSRDLSCFGRRVSSTYVGRCTYICPFLFSSREYPIASVEKTVHREQRLYSPIEDCSVMVPLLLFELAYDRRAMESSCKHCLCCPQRHPVPVDRMALLNAVSCNYRRIYLNK